MKRSPRLREVRLASFELLERRQMLAAHLLRDVDPTPEIITPRQLTAVGDEAFFLAQKGVWKTDGTTSGTQLVRQVGLERWSDVTEFGGDFIFVGTDPDHGAELWTSDGTAEGTHLLRDTNPGSDDGIIPFRDGETFLTIGDSLFFRVQGADRQSLWKTDGTTAGTRLVTQVEHDFLNQQMVSLNAEVYFVTSESALWKSDGSAGGTIPIQRGEFSPSIQIEQATDEYVFFTAKEGFGAEFSLWRTDGTAEGTVPLKALDSADGVTLQDHFVFSQLYTDELWSSDGTVDGTQQLVHVPDLAQVITTLGDRVLLGINGPSGNMPTVNSQPARSFQVAPIANELWAYEWTTKQLQLLTRSWSYFGRHEVWQFGDQMFFKKEGDLWKTDGTEGGTILVTSSVAPNEISTVGDRLLLDNNGLGLLTSAGIPGTTTFFNVDTGLTQDSMPKSSQTGVPTYQDIGDTVLFLADDKLMRTDGTEAGTQEIRRWRADSASFVASPFQGLSLFQVEFEGALELWVSNGTDSGTTKVAAVNEQLFLMFQTQDDVYLRTISGQVWHLDSALSFTQVFSLESVLTQTGSPKITVGVTNGHLVAKSTNVQCVESDCTWSLELRSIQLGSSIAELIARFESSESNERQKEVPFVTFGDSLAFIAVDDLHGQEIWLTDGTVEGTRILFETEPGADSKGPLGLMSVNGALLFETVDTTNNSQLWRTDGTDAGTTVIATDFVPRSERDFREVGDRVAFIAKDGNIGTELWVTDGFTGARIDINPGTGSSFPTFLAEMDGKIFFRADDGIHGYELWVTDGTAANTRMVLDIAPGEFSSFPQIAPTSIESIAFDFFALDLPDPAQYAQRDGNLFFSATTEIHGQELWSTDGTPEGTRLVVDLAAGPASSSPHSITFVEDQLFLAADGGDFGFEPWVYKPGSDPLPGDADGDLEVTFKDFLALAANFGKESAQFSDGDFDGNGTVSFADFLLLAENFGVKRFAVDSHE